MTMATLGHTIALVAFILIPTIAMICLVKQDEKAKKMFEEK